MFAFAALVTLLVLPHALLTGDVASIQRDWVIWSGANPGELFWTASSCETLTLPTNSAPDDPGSGDGDGDSLKEDPGVVTDLILLPATHEVIWLQGDQVLRAWMDRSGKRVLAQLPVGFVSAAGGALVISEILSTIAAGVLLVASAVSGDVLAASLSSYPPRVVSDVGTWVPAFSVGSAAWSPLPRKPVLLIQREWLYWTDNSTCVRRTFVSNALILGNLSRDVQPASLCGDGVVTSFAASDHSIFWIRTPTNGSNFLLERLSSQSFLSDQAEVELLHRFLDGEEPFDLALPQTDPFFDSGLEEQTIYWLIGAPEDRSRLQKLDITRGSIEDISWSSALERRGTGVVQPVALAVYTLPKVCLSIGCLYLQVFNECRKSACTAELCQTCFLDAENWVIKTWVAISAEFSNCVWLFPPEEAQWYVRQQIQSAKESGDLPADFEPVVLARPDRPTPVPSPHPTVSPTVPTLSPSVATTTTTTVTTAAAITTATTTTTTTSTTTTACADYVYDWCTSLGGGQNASTDLFESVRWCGDHWLQHALCHATKPVVVAASENLHVQCEETQDTIWLIVFVCSLIISCLVLALVLSACRLWRRQQSALGPHKDSESPPSARTAQTDHLRNAARHNHFEELFSGFHEEHPEDSEDNAVQAGSKIAQAPCQTHRLEESSNSECYPNVTEPTCPDPPVDRPATPRSPPPILQPPSTDSNAEHSLRWRRASAPSCIEIPGMSPTSPDFKADCLTAPAAAAIAGRLTHAMRKVTETGGSEADRWTWLNDVEDTLQILGNSLPEGMQQNIKDWHTRMLKLLEQRRGVIGARDETQSFLADLREDSACQLRVCLQEAETSALSAALASAATTTRSDDEVDCDDLPPFWWRRGNQLDDDVAHVGRNADGNDTTHRIKALEEQLDDLRSKLQHLRQIDTAPLVRLGNLADRKVRNRLDYRQGLAGNGGLSPQQQDHGPEEPDCEPTPRRRRQKKERKHRQPANFRMAASAEMEKSRDSEDATLADFHSQSSNVSECPPVVDLAAAVQRLSLFGENVKELQMSLHAAAAPVRGQAPLTCAGCGPLLESLMNEHGEAMKLCEQGLSRALDEAAPTSSWMQLTDVWRQFRRALEQVKLNVEKDVAVAEHTLGKQYLQAADVATASPSKLGSRLSNFAARRKSQLSTTTEAASDIPTNKVEGLCHIPTAPNLDSASPSFGQADVKPSDHVELRNSSLQEIDDALRKLKSFQQSFGQLHSSDGHSEELPARKGIGNSEQTPQHARASSIGRDSGASGTQSQQAETACQADRVFLEASQDIRQAWLKLTSLWGELERPLAMAEKSDTSHHIEASAVASLNHVVTQEPDTVPIDPKNTGNAMHEHAKNRLLDKPAWCDAVAFDKNVVENASRATTTASTPDATTQNQSRQRRDFSCSEDDRQALLARAQTRELQLDEELQAQRELLKSKRRRRKLLLLSEDTPEMQSLKRLVEETVQLENLAHEHLQGLQRQDVALEQEMQTDDGEMEQIEAWRQLVGLEELQHAERRRRHTMQVRMTPAEIERARARGQETQGRLEALRADETESQQERMRQLQQRRRRRNTELSVPSLQSNDCRLHASACLPSETRTAFSEARESLARIRSNSTENGSRRIDELASGTTRAILDKTQHRLATLIESFGPLEPSEVQKIEAIPTHVDPAPMEVAPRVVPLQPRKFEDDVKIALDGIEERASMVRNLGAELLRDLEGVFARIHNSSPGEDDEIGYEVTRVVERWRASLRVKFSDAAENDKQADLQAEKLLQRMADRVPGAIACESAPASDSKIGEHACLPGESEFHRQVQTLKEKEPKFHPESLVSEWNTDLGHISREINTQLAEEMHFKQQRRRDSVASANDSNLTRRQSVLGLMPKSPDVSESEVRAARVSGEARARLVITQVDEEAEQQARICLRRKEQRRSRRIALASTSSSLLSEEGAMHPPSTRRSVFSTNSLSSSFFSVDSHDGEAIPKTEPSERVWAWAPRRHSVGVCLDLRE